MARPGKVLLIASALIFVIALGVGLWSRNRPGQSVPFPNPNGYSIFTKAGAMVNPDTGDYSKMGEEALRNLVQTNAVALKLAVTGLSQDCRVVLVYTPNGHWSFLPRFKALAQAFSAEGKLAELDNRSGDAAASYLNCIRLGHETPRGGLIIDSLVGLATEAIGLVGLERAVPKLDAKQCREAAATLELAESRRDPPGAVLEQERSWARQVYGIKGQFARLVTFKSIQQTEQGWQGRVRAQELRTRRLAIRLAARAYELETGKSPSTLAELVPTYLKAIPKDPRTGTNMSLSTPITNNGIGIGSPG